MSYIWPYTIWLTIHLPAELRAHTTTKHKVWRFSMKSSQIQTHYFHFLKKKKKEILESLPLHVLLSRRKEIIINDLGIIFPQLVKARASAEVQNRARSPGPQSLAGWWRCWRTIFPLWMDLQMSDVQEGVGAYQTVSTSICGTHKSSTPSSVTGLPWTTYGYSSFFRIKACAPGWRSHLLA